MRRRNSKGQILVVMSLAVVTLVGAMSLAIDTGVVYYNWMLLQKAADAAVLAGATYLPSDPASATSAVNTFVMSNGVQPTEIVSVAVLNGNTSVTVSLRRTVPYYFAQLLGLTTGTVSASATAGVQAVGSLTGLLPIGIDSRTSYTFGQPVMLMTGQYGPGNWGPLALGGTGASNFNYNLVNGYIGAINVGDMLSTETGLMTGPTRTAFNQRLVAGINSDSSGTFANHTITDQRILTVPMINYSNINGQSEVPVMGFAELWLVSVDNKLTISTYFIQQVVSGTPSPTAQNYGAMSALLVQ
jgi:Flp pilus assembly protein TadG